MKIVIALSLGYIVGVMSVFHSKRVSVHTGTCEENLARWDEFDMADLEETK